MNKEEIINIIKKNKGQLNVQFGVTKIGLFGSYARGQADINSDIDIIVEINNADLFLLVAVKNYLRELLKSEVDIVRFRNKMNAHLKKRILNDVIYV